MATGVWVLDLIDRVTSPAGAIDRTLARLDNRITRISAGTAVLSSRLGVLGAGFRAAEAAGAGAASRISGAWGSVSGHISRANADMRNMLGTMASIGALAASVGYAGKVVMDAASRRETQIVQIGAMLPSLGQDGMKRELQWVNDFADRTPFTNQQTMKLFKQSVGYGYGLDQTHELMRTIGDAAWLTNENPDVASGLVLRAFSQARSKGKWLQQEINQITEHIPGVSQAFDAAFGGRGQRVKLQEQGLLTYEKGEQALLAAWRKSYGGGMEKMSHTLPGMASTLISRPQRIVDAMTDMGGLQQPRRLFRNLISLTDTNSGPGKRLVTNLASAGKEAFDAFFGPLARATEGRRAEQLVDSIVRQIDGLTQWFETNGPTMVSELKGFGDGLKGAADGANLLLAPLRLLGEISGRLGHGGDTNGIIGRVLGFGVGAVVLSRIANWLSFGALGAIGRRAGTALMGSIARSMRPGGMLNYMRAMWPVLARSGRSVGWLRALGLDSLGTALSRTWLGGVVLFMRGLPAYLRTMWPVLMRSVRAVGWVRALGLGSIPAFFKSLPAYLKGLPAYLRTMWPVLLRSARAVGWIRALGLTAIPAFLRSLSFSGLAASASKLTPGVGWLITALTVVKSIGDALYARFDAFAQLIDSLRERMRWMLDRPEDQTTALGRGLTWDPIKWATGQKQAWEVGDDKYAATLSDLSGKLGMSSQMLALLIPRVDARKGTDAYRLGNGLGLDVDHNGVITREEAASALRDRYKQDGDSFRQEVNVYVTGNVDQATLDAIGRAANPPNLHLGIEGGY